MRTPSVSKSEQVRLLKKELLLNTKLLREIQKVAHVGHWQLDFETEITEWSDETFRILGTSRGETQCSLESFLSFVHPDDVDLLTRITYAHLKTQKNYTISGRIVQPGGAVRHIFAAGIFERNRKKKVNRIYGIIHDVTEVKKMQSKICLAEMTGQENERARVSKELHDGLGQSLVGASLKLKSLQMTAKKFDLALAGEIAVVNQTIQNTIEEVRAISHNLSPYLLRKYGLNAAIEHICKSITQLKVSFRSDLKVSIDTSLETMVYRIVQELSNNILKHSEATRARISLSLKKKQLNLLIEDNGNGHTSKRENRDGLGLLNIRNRLDIVGGDMKIASGKNGGTKIQIAIPLLTIS